MATNKEGGDDSANAAIGCLIVVAALAGIVLAPLLLIAWAVLEARYKKLPGLAEADPGEFDEWFATHEKEYRLITLVRTASVGLSLTAVVGLIFTLVTKTPDDPVMSFIGVTALAGGVTAAVSAGGAFLFLRMTEDTRKAGFKKATSKTPATTPPDPSLT